MSDNKESEAKKTIAAHLATPEARKALAKYLSYSPNPTRAKPAAVPAFLLSLFNTVFLPALPALITLAAPKILASEKLQKIIKAVRDVAIGLVGPAES